MWYFNPLMHDVPKYDQTYFKNFVANVLGFLKWVWPFWNIMH